MEREREGRGVVYHVHRNYCESAQDGWLTLPSLVKTGS